MLAAFDDPSDSRVFLGAIDRRASAKPGEPRLSDAIMIELHGYDDCDNCDDGMDDGG